MLKIRVYKNDIAEKPSQTSQTSQRGENMEHSEFYTQYLQSPEWAAKKAERLQIDGGRCVMCGRSVDHVRTMNTHHITYCRLGDEDVYTDLVTVCGSCHKKLHGYLARRKSRYVAQ